MGDTLRVVGCGDAFGTGGRGNTCFLLSIDGATIAIDFGATTLPAMRGAGLDPAAIDVILLSHLHGDHFGGLPFLLMDAAYNARRHRPLVVVGPPGTEARLFDTLERLYPGAGPNVRARVAIEFVALAEGETTRVGPVGVRPFQAVHPSGAPSYILRVETARAVIGFSGDTAWTDALLEAARGTDVFLCECQSFETPVPNHLTYREVEGHAAALGTRRLILTHRGREMEERRADVAVECADDGMVVEL